MKIIITSSGNNLSSPIDKRFGRAQWFCLYDNELDNTSFIENTNVEAQGGAGTKTAEKMVELGVKRIISGHFGPKAKTILDKFKIQLVEIDEEITIEQLIAKIKTND